MPITMQTNLLPMIANRQIGSNVKALQKVQTSMASGKRINSAADDAAGLAISQNLTAIARSQSQAIRNINDAVSMTQVGDSALSSQSDALVRMRELAVQAANGTLNDNQREMINQELQQLKESVTDTANNTQFNGRNLLDGSTDQVDIQAGEGSDPEHIVSVSFSSSTASALGIDTTDVSSQAGAQSALEEIDSAIDEVSSRRTDLGSSVNSLEHRGDYVESARTNTAASRSRILDTDYASASSQAAQNEILAKAAVAVAAQSNNIQSMIASQLLG